MSEFFTEVSRPIGFGGLHSTDPLAFKVYQPDRPVLGSRMEDHLRVAVCLWHSFDWPGSDVFGASAFDRPWLDRAPSRWPRPGRRSTRRASSSPSSASVRYGRRG